MIRQAIVAGTFYPSSAEALTFEINSYLNQAKKTETKKPLAIIAPHAGYTYSALCAAHSFNAIKNNNYKTAVIIAPSHRVGGFDFSVGNYDYYQTPLGKIEVDTENCEKLLNQPDFEFLNDAHVFEHSIEVQLPFLQITNPNCKIVPVLFSHSCNTSYFADTLLEQFENQLDSTIFIISSDLSHYHSAEKAIKMDELLASKIDELDLEAISTLTKQNKVEACGLKGIITIIKIAKQLNLKAQKLCYTHSGMQAGDNSSVVGYLSTVFTK